MRRSWRVFLTVVLVALPLAAGMTAAAAQPGVKPAAKPSPSAFTSVTLAQTRVSPSGCDLTLTYSWRGFHRVWRYGISVYAGAYPSTDWVATYGARTSDSGNATLTYTMPAGAQGTFYGKGTLWTEADNLISGSFKTTPDLFFACPAGSAASLTR